MRYRKELSVVCVLVLTAGLWASPGLAQEPAPPEREEGSEELECGRCSTLSEGYDRGPWAVEYESSPGVMGCNPRVTFPGAAGNCPRVAADVADGGDGGSSGGSPASLPAPPSLSEAVATCPSPQAPVLGRDPDPEGVTGMDIYLWAQPQETLSSTGSVRGHPVACTITPVRWTWRTGDGGAYTRERPGGPYPDHAAEHVYETKGDYELALTVVWQAATTHGTAEVTRTSTEPYHVFEIRSVLTG